MHHLTFTGVDQYKYGKNRVEADAKKLQAKEDELMKRKQEIRNRLTQLKKDRKDLRTAIDNNTGEDVNGHSSLTESVNDKSLAFKGLKVINTYIKQE